MHGYQRLLLDIYGVKVSNLSTFHSNLCKASLLTCLPRLFSLAPLRILAMSSNLRSLYPGSVKGRSNITLFSAPMSSTRSAHMLGSLLAADTSAVSSSLLPETSCQIINGCALFYGRSGMRMSGGNIFTSSGIFFMQLQHLIEVCRTISKGNIFGNLVIVCWISQITPVQLWGRDIDVSSGVLLQT